MKDQMQIKTTCIPGFCGVLQHPTYMYSTCKTMYIHVKWTRVSSVMSTVKATTFLLASHAKHM